MNNKTDNKKVIFVKDFTMTPGGRFIKDGNFSGEEYRDKYLKAAFNESKCNNQILVVNLDGGYGYATSFLEEAFGGLARETNDYELLNIEIVSDEEPELINKVKSYIKESLK